MKITEFIRSRWNWRTSNPFVLRGNLVAELALPNDLAAPEFRHSLFFPLTKDSFLRKQHRIKNPLWFVLQLAFLPSQILREIGLGVTCEINFHVIGIIGLIHEMNSCSLVRRTSLFVYLFIYLFNYWFINLASVDAIFWFTGTGDFVILTIRIIHLTN